MMRVAILPKAIILKEISRCVRRISSCPLPLPFISRAAKPTALLMIPHDLMIPMIPDIAMPPIPIERAYDLKITSGAICPTAVVIDGSHWFSTVSGKMSAIPGTISHHTVSEPTQMMKAYFRPMI